LVKCIGQENLVILAKTSPQETNKQSKDISAGQIKEEYLGDCYKKQSKRDVPMMKGDWGPRLKKTYKRWDKDLQTWDVREKGSLPLKRRNTKCKTLAKTYMEFAALPYDMSLGTARSLYGVIGLSALRKAIREKGVLLPENKVAQKAGAEPVKTLSSEISPGQIKEELLPDVYKKMSPRDVPMMKGDWGPRLKKSYKRRDNDLKVWDKREKGSLRLRRRDARVKILAEKYSEFASLPSNMTLGTARSLYGVIGLDALRKAIREKGVLLPTKK